MGKGFVALVICLATLAMAARDITSTARADILCQEDNLDTLKARPADCPTGEKKIDPVTLGLQGPQDLRVLSDRRAPLDPQDLMALSDRRAPTASLDPWDPRALSDRRTPTALWDRGT
jgi:hypothetical protein